MSDNPNAFPGFVPCGEGGQGEYKGRLVRAVHPAADGTAVYKYSVVKRDGGVDATTGFQTVIAAGDTDVPYGIVVSMDPEPTSLNTHYCVASTRRVLLIALFDDQLWFKAVGDDVGLTLDATHIGYNAIQETSGITASTITGHSNLRLDSSAVTTTGTQSGANYRIVALDSTLGQSIVDGDKYKVFICRANYSQDKDTTGV